MTRMACLGCGEPASGTFCTLACALEGAPRCFSPAPRSPAPPSELMAARQRVWYLERKLITLREALRVRGVLEQWPAIAATIAAAIDP